MAQELLPMSSGYSPQGKAAREADLDLSDEARLDQAMRRGDQLLVASLQEEEKHRRRQRNFFLFGGGIVMMATLCAVAFYFGALEPANANADKAANLTQQGWRLWQKQEFGEAAKQFEQAVDLDIKNVSAWNGLGWARFNLGERATAAKAFGKAIELEPSYPAALNGLGQLSLLERKYGDAEKYLLKAAPQAPAAWYGLARVYLLEGKYSEAAKWAKKVIDTGEADEITTAMLKAAEAKSLPDELRKQIEPPAPVAAKPAGDANVGRAWQLMNQGRLADARAMFETLLKKSPDDANALNGMGWLLFNAGDGEKAKPYFERAIKADKKAAGSMNGLARILYAEGKKDEAVKLWEQMVKDFPGANAGTYGLADAYLEKGEFKKAIPLLEELHKAEPGDKQIEAKLKRAREAKAD
jgi:Flp pilus assembly protein TadD